MVANNSGSLSGIFFYLVRIYMLFCSIKLLLPPFQNNCLFWKKNCFNLRNQEYFIIFLPILPLFLLFPTKFNNILQVPMFFTLKHSTIYVDFSLFQLVLIKLTKTFHIFFPFPINKEQNIGIYGYIGTWILRKYRKYRKISVDILTKISVMQKLTKIL